MTINERVKWNDGKQLWNEYIQVNGYSFQPNEQGLTKLSKLLDLNKSWIKERIALYLDN